MTAAYAVSLAVGAILLAGWVTYRGLSRSAAPRGSSAVSMIAAGFVAFGLAGMSAKFAGWPAPAHGTAAVVAAAGAVAYTRWTRSTGPD
jgi:hypothetical protein